jgi:membrane-bound lytic murein transglycosylase B
VSHRTLTGVIAWALGLAVAAVCAWVFYGVFVYREPSRALANDGGSAQEQWQAVSDFVGEDVSTPEAVIFAPTDDSSPDVIRGNADRVDPAWARTISGATGIPQRALLSYAGTALAMQGEAPGCHLSWPTLAALGAVESGHGTHNGSRLDAAGTAYPAIYGPVLGGDLEGQTAQGPLQFIAPTWATWGADGNGDGFRNPQNLDDAALAAARYLCHYGDLSQGENWQRAIFAYNHLDSYVTLVATTSREYAQSANAVRAP